MGTSWQMSRVLTPKSLVHALRQSGYASLSTFARQRQEISLASWTSLRTRYAAPWRGLCWLTQQDTPVLPQYMIDNILDLIKAATSSQVLTLKCQSLA